MLHYQTPGLHTIAGTADCGVKEVNVTMGSFLRYREQYLAAQRSKNETKGA